MKRAEKIKLLVGIAQGHISVDSLKPEPFLLRMDLGNGIISHYKEGALIDGKQWQKESQGMRKKNVTLSL